MRHFIEGIKNLLCWLPIIWHDRQYDHCYLYKILAHKLAMMEKWYKSDEPWSVGAAKLGDSIRYCKCLVGRLEDDDYLNRQLLPWHRKWGEMWLMERPLDSDNGRCYLGFDCTNARTEQDRIRADEEFGKYGNEADRQKKQDLDELFRLLRKWSEYWWD